MVITISLSYFLKKKYWFLFTYISIIYFVFLDVSMAAMQYINSYYMGHNLQHEGQFMRQCMTHLLAATEDLIYSSGRGVEDPPLLCIQRALLLMKSHLDAFKRR